MCLDLISLYQWNSLAFYGQSWNWTFSHETFWGTLSIYTSCRLVMWLFSDILKYNKTRFSPHVLVLAEQGLKCHFLGISTWLRRNVIRVMVQVTQQSFSCISCVLLIIKCRLACHLIRIYIIYNFGNILRIRHSKRFLIKEPPNLYYQV